MDTNLPMPNFVYFLYLYYRLFIPVLQKSCLISLIAVKLYTCVYHYKITNMKFVNLYDKDNSGSHLDPSKAEV